MHTSSLRVVVIGATGRVGALLVEYALEAGHQVTAAARDASRLLLLQQRLEGGAHAGSRHSARTIVSDVLAPASLRGAVEGAEVVLSALAAPHVERPGETLSRGMHNLVLALTTCAPAAHVRCIAGAGILPAADGRLMYEQAGFPEVYRALSRQHAEAWAQLRESELSWTVVCPPDMPSGARTRRYRTETERMPEGGAVVSAEDVADFMVRDGTERRYERVRVGIAY